MTADPDVREERDVQVFRDVRIPTADRGVTLSADVYRPVGAGTLPALVTTYPYRKDLMAMGLGVSLRWFAERGYASLHVELRGVGSSDGVPSHRCDAGWVDDSVSAIEWVASQPWCSGAVGMWGASAGAITALGAATRLPAPLKAIIPIMGTLDPERYSGQRGDFGLIVQAAGGSLVQQLLPPLVNHTSAAEQRRWHRRLHDIEPVVLDLARHGTGDPDWRARVLDAQTIVAPTLCIAGWQDLYLESMTRIYEQIAGPKKLLLGPWMHTFPQDAPVEPIDFLSIALRWWDHWLRGVDNGVMDEPPVSLYVDGIRPGWRGFESWPPATDELVLLTGRDTTLTKASTEKDCDRRPIAEYRPDPTIGALSGLGGESTGIGLPLDQHDDDMRALSITSEPTTDVLAILGCPEVRVTLAQGDALTAAAPPRLVVRLKEVDPEGRSTLLSTGVVSPNEPAQLHRLALAPTTRRVKAGHRLRIVISDADFPRLTPLVDPPPISVAAVELSIPVVSEDAGTAADVPPAPRPSAVALMMARPDPAGGERWSITRDLIHDEIEVAVGRRTPRLHTVEGHLYETHTDTRAKVRRDAPEAFIATGKHEANVRMRTGESIRVVATVRCTQTGFWLRGDVSIDDITTFSRTWEAPLGHARLSQ